MMKLVFFKINLSGCGGVAGFQNSKMQNVFLLRIANVLQELLFLPPFNHLLRKTPPNYIVPHILRSKCNSRRKALPV